MDLVEHARSRRQFLVGLGAAATVLVAAGCQPGVVPPLPIGSPAGDGSGAGDATPVAPTAPVAPVEPVADGHVADPLSRASWLPLVGSALLVSGPEGNVPVVLDHIDDVAGRTGDDGAFALGFRGTDGAAPLLSQGTTVRDGAGEDHHLDLFPTDRGIDHRWFRAVVLAAPAS